MKLPISTLCRSLLLAAFAYVSLSATASGFEGRVHMEMSSDKKKDNMEMEYVMKGDKLRIEPQLHERNGRAGAMGMIMDMQAREMIILMDMDGRKMFMRRPMPQTVTDNVARNAQEHHVAAPQPTGRTEMIAGYKATEYRTTTDKGEVVELWLAQGFGPFMSMTGGNPMTGRGAPPPGWENFVRDGNYFPMRVVSHDKKGNETMHMEVTRVEKGHVDDSLFSTEGYSEFQMPGFGGTGGFNPFKRD
jgi:hypothetical protein